MDTARITNSKIYDELLAHNVVRTPKTRPDAKHVFHLYVIRSKNRENLIQSLDEAGIQTAIHYPTALPFLDAYKQRGYTAGDFPVAYATQSEILSVPMFAELTRDEIAHVCETINAAKNIVAHV